MAGNSNSEKRMLAECAEEGFCLLDAHFRDNPVDAFLSAPFVPQPRGMDYSQGGYLYHNNADIFYACLSMLHATDDEQLIAKIITRNNPKSDLQRALDAMEHLMYQGSSFEQDLAEYIFRYSQLSDEEIRRGFSERFDIKRVDMMSFPTDGSLYFAKVNHGYWEYMRSSYDDAHGEREQFREIDVASKVRRLRTSGVTQLWGSQISSYLMREASAKEGRHVSLAVSLTAGTESPAVSIGRELNEVTRGAAIGLMSMFEAAAPQIDCYRLGDGGAARDLITNQMLDPFFEKYVSDSEACVFVVPKHLKQIGFKEYSGSIYKFLVPATIVNETWKTVAASLLGYLVLLSRQHRSITLMVQGASIASLMAMLFADVDALKRVRIRYFDMGRVLDVAAPDFLQKQAWAKKGFNEYVKEGSKVFCASATDDFVLASLP